MVIASWFLFTCAILACVAPRFKAVVAVRKIHDEVGRKICELRTKAGLTLRQLAKLVGTNASVICRLEDADYDGHSLPLLRRIATVPNRRVEIRFVPLRRKSLPPETDRLPADRPRQTLHSL
jgi:transcriptional regulator with XRE-family HTH domain